MKKQKTYRVRLWIGGVLIFIAMVVFMAALWCWNTFGNVPFDQILYHLLVPAEGTNADVFIEFSLHYLPFALLFTLLILMLVVRWTKNQAILHVTVRKKEREISVIPFRFLRRHFALFGVLVFILSLGSGASILQIPQYVNDQMHPSTLFEEQYVNPKTASLTFPERKRNLIYIFLESMENTYASKDVGGNRDVDLIPELSSLALNNVSFSNTDMLGGALAAPGTTWTVAAMTAQTAGIPMKVPLDGNTYGTNNTPFLPGAYSLGEILEQEGYNQMLMIGSEAVFGGRDAYFTQHGHYEIWDYNTAKETGKIAEDYKVWWGFEDAKLFEYAKEELTRLAGEDEPFNFTMLTVDTHFEGGYVCQLCQNEHADQYSNVLSCSSRQVGEFVEWVQQQNFYENTTIILCGDHNCMSKTYFTGDTGYQRTTYNAFINLPLEVEMKWLEYDEEGGYYIVLGDEMAEYTRNREFCSMDMYPTTLAALGVQIEGERLGLGTNLFSGKPTLIEEMGRGAFFGELNKASRFYDKYLLYGSADAIPETNRTGGTASAQSP